MAVNLTMAPDGMDAFIKGFGLTDNLMKQLLERRELKQRQDQFKEELALKKQAAARAGANSDLHRSILEQQLLGLKHKNDPNYEYDQFNRMFGGGGGGAPQGQGQPQGDNYPAVNKMFAGQGAFPQGEMEHGNIDLGNRPKVPNPETGGESTVWSMSIGTPKGEVLIPRVSQDGRILSKEEAVDQFHKTGEHLGIYSSPEEATRAAEMIHQQQAQSVGAKPGQHLLDVLKNDPIKRAYFKHKYKFDPLAADKTSAYQGSAREAVDLERLKNEYGENSEVYQNAKAEHEAKVDAKKDLRDLRARTKAGLKPGEKEFFDEQSGEPLGKEIPLTAKERESEEGNIIFNELYPLAYKGASPFSGEGAIGRMEKAFSNYKNDPQARKLVDDLLLADKAMAATVVNEASTLKAGKTNQTYRMLKEALEAQDVPKLIKKYFKEYKLPASAQLKAGMRYQKALSQARNKARKGTPATQKLFYNPDMQAQHEAENAEGNLKGTKIINGVTYYPDGQGGWEHD